MGLYGYEKELDLYGFVVEHTTFNGITFYHHHFRTIIYFFLKSNFVQI